MKSSDNAIVVVLHKKNIKYLEKFKQNLNKENYNYDIIFFCDYISNFGVFFCRLMYCKQML